MLFWPVTTSYVEVLSSEVKKEIARRVTEVVYRELRNGQFLQSAYLREIAFEIASKSIDLAIVRHPECDGFIIKARLK